MEHIGEVWIYNSSERAFAFGSISFDEKFREVSFETSRVFDGRGDVVIPGLIDCHMHIESSMLPPSSFSVAATSHGTTTLISDCHEIANVAGTEGLRDFMHQESVNHLLYAIPSSVPASSRDLETTVGNFDADTVEALSSEKGIVCLGEVMNAEDLFSDEDNRTKRMIAAFRQYFPTCPIEGHIARLSGRSLDAFISYGISSDHTEQTVASLKEKLAKGVFIQLQYKALTEEIVAALKSEYDGHFSLVTDDVLPDVLLSEGQLDRVLRRAVELGLPIERAIYAATYAPANHMHLDDRGIIAPGHLADFIVLDSLSDFSIKEVYVSGRCVYRKGDGLLVPRPETRLKECYVSSIKRRKVTSEDFILRTGKPGLQKITAIMHLANTTMTEQAEVEIDVEQDCTVRDGRVNILAAVERYGHESPIVPVPLVGGLDRRGAIASSWAHDSHNILVLATDPALAAKAVNLVIEGQGGIACTDDDDTLFVPLHYGGIVSLEPEAVLAEKIAAVRLWLREHGYRAVDEIMSFAVLSLPVSPALKVTDKGLVDVRKKQVIDWRSE